MFRALKIGALIVMSVLSTIALAKDLYVATDGNDSVSYANNDINNPWKTITVGVYQLKAGDTLYIRQGAYTPEYTMYTKNDYTSKVNGNPYDMNAESGTASDPVTIRNYPGDHVVIDLANIGQFIGLDNMHYWVFDGLNIINSRIAFHIGYDNASTHHTFRNMSVTASQGGDNAGAMKIEGNGEYTTIEYSVLTGPGTGSSVHLNTGSIYVTRVNNLVVRNNILENAPFGLYFKHANDGAESDVNILVENNLFQNHSRRSLETNSNYAVFRNNLFGKSNAGVRNNEANGYPGGDHNQYIHNTFYDGTVTLSGDTQSGDSNPGSIGNHFEGNLFTGSVNIHPYSSQSTTVTGEGNMFDPDDNSRSFGSYQTVETLVSKLDLTSSVFGDPTFEDNTFQSIFGFELNSASIGSGEYNGNDVGADISNIGPNLGVRPQFGDVIKVNEAN